MRRKPDKSTQAKPAPTMAQIVGVWRADRCLSASTRRVYLSWIARFRLYCGERGLDESTELTLKGARRFIAWYARRRGLDPGGPCTHASTALFSLSRVHQVLGLDPPCWNPAATARPAASPLLRAFQSHLLEHRGNAASTVHLMLTHVNSLLNWLGERGSSWRTMTLPDIDAFLIDCGGRYSRSTTAGIASSTRAFMRFLFATGRSKTDLAAVVIAPVRRRYERPLRALPWPDV